MPTYRFGKHAPKLDYRTLRFKNQSNACAPAASSYVLQHYGVTALPVPGGSRDVFLRFAPVVVAAVSPDATLCGQLAGDARMRTICRSAHRHGQRLSKRPSTCGDSGSTAWPRHDRTAAPPNAACRRSLVPLPASEHDPLRSRSWSAARRECGRGGKHSHRKMKCAQPLAWGVNSSRTAWQSVGNR